MTIFNRRIMMATFLEELKQHVDESNASYFKRKVEEIKEEIRTCARAGETSVWITFDWDEGNYEGVIEYFQKEGVDVGSPTGPDRGEYTSYLFKWEI